MVGTGDEASRGGVEGMGVREEFGQEVWISRGSGGPVQNAPQGAKSDHRSDLGGVSGERDPGKR